MRRRTSVLRGMSMATLALATVVAVGLPVAPQAAALQPPVAGTAGSDPIDNTPRVRDGQVLAIARTGDRVVVGGSFTTVDPGSGGGSLTRNRLFSYRHSTGQVDPWNPNVNGNVEAVAISADGRWVYAAGYFRNASGSSAQRIARWDLATGQRDTGFAPRFNAGVNDMELRGDVIYAGGKFTAVSGVPRERLAAVHATTGAVLELDLPVTEPHTAGTATQVRKLDLDAGGQRMVLIGNFRRVDGADRRQLAVVDLDGQGGGSVASSWRTQAYTPTCASSFHTYMRDVEVSPDGTWFAVNTTGAWGGADRLCDSTARFELDTTGSDVQPTWVNHTGGDTLYGIAITPQAVYIGGHQRWSNNSTPPRGDAAGPGSVVREGIAALDPLTGLPLSWNPGKQRGVGTFEITASDDALLIGHDTNMVAGEFRPRLSGFLMDGSPNIEPEPTGLPATIVQGRANGSLRTARLAPGVVEGVAGSNGGAVPWQNLDGAFVQRGQLYAFGLDGGLLTRRSFDGTTAGAPTDLVAEAGYAVGPPSQLNRIRAAAYDAGRIYYLRSGSSRLHWRWFALESGVVGSREFTASTANWSSVVGIEIADGRLFHTRTDGRLYSQQVQGASVGGPTVLVDATTDWRGGNDLLLIPEESGPGPDVTPPSAPGRPSASSDAPGRADLSWSAATDDRASILTYQVFRDGVPVGSVDGPTSGQVTFVETGLEPGSVHTWTVRATDGVNVGPHSPASAPVTIAGAPDDPPDPTDPAVVASDFSDGLAGWTAVSGMGVDPAVGSPTGTAPSAVANVADSRATTRLDLPEPLSAACTEVDVRVSTLVGNARYSLFKLRSTTGASMARVWVDRWGHLSVRDDINKVRLDTPGLLPAGQWRRIGLCVTVGDGAGLALTVDGAVVGQWPAQTGPAPYGWLQLGDNDPRTATVHFDDVVVSSTG